MSERKGVVQTTNTDDKYNNKLSDQQLVADVVSHEPGASDLFVERYYRFIFKILARDLKLSQEDAEDLHQEIFLRLFEDSHRRLRNWIGEGSFVSYLGPIVRNLANDWFRKRKVRGEVPLDSDDDDDYASAVPEPAGTDPSPEDVAASAEQRRRLYEAMDELSGRDREIIRLRHLEELSYRELAEKMGYTCSSIGVILARAEKRLKKALDHLL